jgi:hypothetical protein
MTSLRSCAWESGLTFAGRSNPFGGGEVVGLEEAMLFTASYLEQCVDAQCHFLNLDSGLGLGYSREKSVRNHLRMAVAQH